MSLYYDRFRFNWAVVTKKRLNIVFAKVPIPFRWNYKR